MRELPPKIPTFSGSHSKRLERGPQYSVSRRNFQTSPCMFVVLRLSYNPSQRNDASFQYLRRPTQKAKKVPFRPIWHRFQPNSWGTAVFKMRSHFVDLSSSTYAELKTYVGTFENFAYGLRNRGVSAGLLGHNQKKWSVFSGQFED